MKIFERILNLFFPKDIKCIFCGEDVKDFENTPYCEDCKKEKFFNVAPKRCKICDDPIYSESDYCDNCKKEKKHFDKAIAPFLYEGKVRSMILRFKNDNAKYLAQPMAKLMAERIKDEKIEVDAIVAVPLSEKSLKRRGYNQSLLLAREIAKLLDKPVYEDVLTKTKETKHQKELSYQDRQKNLAGAFHVENWRAVKDKSVLLVDDIITTCATADYLSKLLKKHAKAVYVSAFARRTKK